MKKINEVKEVHDSILEAAISAIDETIHTDAIEIGEHVRQGDLYLTRVSLSWPHGRELPGRQLVAGSSPGSRHIAEGPLRMYAGDPASKEICGLLSGAENSRVRALLTGPVVVADDRWINAHPEHADHALPAGCYQITYQLDPREEVRVRD